MLSRPGEIVRRHDPDRFLTALFAPPNRREALFVLYAVNHELARARAAVSEPMMALIRLQWWRELAEGARRRHEIAGPLGEAIDAGRLSAADVLAMIDGREAEADGIATLEDWRGYLMATAGGVAVAASRALGATEEMHGALRLLGAAYGASGVLRSVPALAAQGRCMLPEDVLSEQGLSAGDAVTSPGDPRLRPVLDRLAAEGRGMLAEGRRARLPRWVIAAALPAVFARRDLARPGRSVEARGIGDRLAVLMASVLGRV